MTEQLATVIVTTVVVSMAWGVPLLLRAFARRLKRDRQQAMLHRHRESVFGRAGFELKHGRHRKLKNYEALLDPQILVNCGENGTELIAAMKCR